MKDKIALSQGELVGVFAIARHFERSLDHSLGTQWLKLEEYYDDNGLIEAVELTLSGAGSFMPTGHGSQDCQLDAPGFWRWLYLKVLMGFRRFIGYYTIPVAVIGCARFLFRSSIEMICRVDSPTPQEIYELRFMLTRMLRILELYCPPGKHMCCAERVESFNQPFHLDHYALRGFLAFESDVTRLVKIPAVK